MEHAKEGAQLFATALNIDFGCKKVKTTTWHCKGTDKIAEKLKITMFIYHKLKL